MYTVFRHVPRPIIGMIGVVHDHGFSAFEASLDWLETTGALVERLDPEPFRRRLALILQE